MKDSTIVKIVVGSIAFIVLVIATTLTLVIVPEGKVAVIYSPNGGVNKVLDPGWSLKGPFHKSTKYPTKITIVETNLHVTTKDGKKIGMPVRYEMKVDKSKIIEIFQELGSQNIEQIQEGYLYQRLFQSSRVVISEYSVLDIFGTKTSEASARVTEGMIEASGDLGFIITNVVLGNPEVDELTQDAIDQRVRAAQENELKKQELENEKIEAEKKEVISQGEKVKSIIDAEAEADSKLIKAEAEAKSNKKLDASLTDNVLKKMEMEARQKHGWITIQGTTPIIDATK